MGGEDPEAINAELAKIFEVAGPLMEQKQKAAEAAAAPQPEASEKTVDASFKEV
jgi:hypothetical protein